MNVTANASMSVIVRARERAVTANASMSVIVRARERAAQRTKINVVWKDCRHSIKGFCVSVAIHLPGFTILHRERKSMRGLRV